MNRVRELIHKHIDRDATPEELAELGATLRASRAAARHFADACRIDAFLSEEFAQSGRSPEVSALIEAHSRGAPPPEPKARRRRVPFLALTAAAVVILAVGAAVLYGLWPHRRAAARYELLAGHVLINGQKSQRVAPGARLVVPSTQRAVLRLGDGTRAELDPSSEVVLRGEGRGVREAVELVEGRGRFQVTEGGGRFRVETALGLVTALGTDFTVELWSAEPPGSGEHRSVRALAVAVDSGRVQVDLDETTHELTAGESRAFAVGVRDGGRCAPPSGSQETGGPGRDGVALLPLPASPSRRTETKERPRPPAVVVKLKTDEPADWATDPHDIHTLLAWMSHKLELDLGYQEKRLDEVELDAARLPMLYRTGHNAFTLTDAERKRLRDYVLNGGFVYFDACCGRRAFARAVRRELAAVLPDREFQSLPADHPLYHCYYDVPRVAYTPATGIEGMAPPPLEGIDVGCRTAVVFSPYDLSCGWAMHTHRQAKGVRCEYALKLGANLIAYATATRAMGISLAESRVYEDSGEALADKFRIGQIVHDGQWNPDPAGLANLLDIVRTNTSVKVSFATQPLRLDSGELSHFPFLYLTGHGDFRLDDPEVAALRAYLEAGGFLLADACCGRKAFDAAFRREMARVLPDQRLARLSSRHGVYSIHHRIRTVGYTQAAVLQRGRERLGAPALEGITIEGQLAVVYSPLDLGCGWELKPHPYGVGYEWRDAIRLGVNVVLDAASP
ncbi:MAG: DUF4159 domain-containing protein [bacterium]